MAGLTANVARTTLQGAIVATAVLFGGLLLADFVSTSAWGVGASTDPLPIWSRLHKRARLTGSPDPDDGDFSREVFYQRLRAYYQNASRIKLRRRLMALMRLALFAAVVLSSAAALQGGSSATNGQSTNTTQTHKITTNSSDEPRRHHNQVG